MVLFYELFDFVLIHFTVQRSQYKNYCVITSFISLTLYDAILTCFYFLNGFSMNLLGNVEFEVLEGGN